MGWAELHSLSVCLGELERNSTQFSNPIPNLLPNKGKKKNPFIRLNFPTILQSSAMELAAKIRAIDLQSSFLSGTAPIRTRSHPILTQSTRAHLSFSKKHNFTNFRTRNHRVSARIAAETLVSEAEAGADLESLFSESSVDEGSNKQGKKKSNTGASSISSGIRLENVSKSFKGVTVLKDVSWEVKKGEKVGLVGVNGAGKTTQLKIIAGLDEPDSGNLIKAKENMKIAFLSQEFEVCPTRTVKEEFLSAFKEEMEVAERLEKVQKALEGSVEDLELMGRLLDELDLLQRRARDVDLDAVEVKISKLLPELGFVPEDSDRLVASFSGGWQMRMSLGKILLQVCLFSVKDVVAYRFINNFFIRVCDLLYSAPLVHEQAEVFCLYLESACRTLCTKFD